MMIDKRIPKKDLSVEELIQILNDAGYSNISIERILELEIGVLDKWINGKEDITCVGLTLLRILSTYPWMLDVAENNFEEDSKINMLKDIISKSKQEG